MQKSSDNSFCIFTKEKQKQVRKPLLSVERLVVTFDTVNQGPVKAVDDVTFQLFPQEILGIAGESGCGKSVTALSLIRLLPRPVANIIRGRILYGDKNILNLSPKKMCSIRGKKIAMIFQEPMTALNPVHTAGHQIKEIFNLHFPKMTRLKKNNTCLELLDKVSIPDPIQVAKKYPHQLSGGIRQRIMIAMALACEPDILIADEPTTALDVTIQSQILELIRNLQEKTGMSVILITHDLGIIAENCDRAMIMYAGRIAETASVKQLFSNPCHPYTLGLLASIPASEKIHKSHLSCIKGNVPSLAEMTEGCRFAPRCDMAKEICHRQIPGENIINNDHMIACHLYSPRIGVKTA